MTIWRRISWLWRFDQIHDLILEDCWISAKSMGFVHLSWRSDMRNLSAKWVPKCLKADQHHQRCQTSEQIWNFFGAIQKIFCRDWWPWTKHGYITMTRRQNNNHWSGDTAAHRAPRIKPSEKSAGKFSPRFFGIKTSSSSLIMFQRTKLSTRSITHHCSCN